MFNSLVPLEIILDKSWSLIIILMTFKSMMFLSFGPWCNMNMLHDALSIHDYQLFTEMMISVLVAVISFHRQIKIFYISLSMTHWHSHATNKFYKINKDLTQTQRKSLFRCFFRLSAPKRKVIRLKLQIGINCKWGSMIDSDHDKQLSPIWYLMKKPKSLPSCTKKTDKPAAVAHF